MSRAKRMGIDIDAAEMPETIGGEWLIEDLFAAGGVASDAMGVRGLAWGELEAWARMTRTSLEPWEADALYRLSAAYAAALDASKDPDQKPYWAGEELAAAKVEQIERAEQSISMIFGALAARSNPEPNSGA